MCAEYKTSTTTTIYDIDVPGSNPIRIVEGEPLWKSDENRPPSNFEHRSFNGFTTISSQTNLNYPTEEENVEFAPVALQEFLTNYANMVKNNRTEQTDDSDKFESVDLITQPSDTPEEKSKSWNIMNYETHKHPYEDKQGWVSLEPVPWSVSKISKWKPNVRPSQKPWNDYGSNEQQWENDFAEFPSDQNTGFNIKPQRPNSYFDKPTLQYGLEQSNINKFGSYQYKKPSFPKPTAVYSHKVQLRPSFSETSHKTPLQISGYYKNEENESNKRNDIITDGLPANFPTAFRESLRRRGTEIHPETHPANGEGEWVLLSTTKGYKYPKHRQRSLEVKPQSLGIHRSVRLTVLPPLKNSKVNMTTSHGGLLQVESSFETVDQAQKKYAKKQKLKKKPNKRPFKNQLINKKGANTRTPVQIVLPTMASVPRRSTGSDTSAVLAAVGAGMIPATMAMLVPMAMNGRRKRDTSFVTSNPYSSVEITLPRNI